MQRLNSDKPTPNPPTPITNNNDSKLLKRDELLHCMQDIALKLHHDIMTSTRYSRSAPEIAAKTFEALVRLQYGEGGDVAKEDTGLTIQHMDEETWLKTIKMVQGGQHKKTRAVAEPASSGKHKS